MSDTLWLRNERPPVQLANYEFVGPPRQDTFIDPLGKSGYLHKGIPVEDLERDGYVGVYIKLVDVHKKP